MVAFKGHFDGQVIVPSEPVLLPRDRELVFQVEPGLPAGADGQELLKLLEAFDGQSAKEIGDAIEAECERIDDDEW